MVFDFKQSQIFHFFLKKFYNFLLKYVTSRSLRIWPISFIRQEFPFRVSCPNTCLSKMKPLVSRHSLHFTHPTYDSLQFRQENRLHYSFFLCRRVDAPFRKIGALLSHLEKTENPRVGAKKNINK